jgi:hypothetical protein
LVSKYLLGLGKKTVIPFGTVSSAFLFTSFDKAKAASVFEVKGPLTHILSGTRPSEPILSGGPNVFQEFRGLFENIQAAVDWCANAVDWLHHLPEHIANFSVYLLVKLYDLLMLVLQTPLFIFNNTYIKDAALLFSGISILMVTLLTMYEGMKMMMQKRHTDLKTITKRFFVAMAGAGIAPYLFEKSFQLINMLTASIAKIGSAGLKMNDTKGTASIVNPYMNPSAFDWFNTLALVAFDVMLIATMIPIILQNGRRFFDLMCLCALTPLALGCWVFKEQKYLFDKWWFNVKKLGSTPIIYSIFICILGLFIFGTKNAMTPGGMLIKIIIIVGGLTRMANIPSFVRSRVDEGPTADESIMSGYKKVKDMLTLKKLKNFHSVKDKVKTNNEKKQKTIKSLRKQHGRRYVGDLLK